MRARRNFFRGTTTQTIFVVVTVLLVLAFELVAAWVSTGDRASLPFLVLLATACIMTAALLAAVLAGRVREARDQRSRAESAFETLLAAETEFGDGVAITEGRRFAYVNDPFVSLTGFSRKDLEVMGSLDVLLAREERSRLADRFLLTDTTARAETIIVRADGKPIPVELTRVSRRVEEVDRVVVVVRDISKRKLEETNLRRRVRQQESIALLGQVALARESLPALLEKAATAFTTNLDVEFSAVLGLAPDGRTFQLLGASGWPNKEAARGLATDARDAQAAFVLGQNGPVVVEDFRAETRFPVPAVVHAFGIRSGISVPIRLAGRSFGIAGAFSLTPHAFSGDDIAFAQNVANLTAAAVEREETERRLRQAEKMAAVGTLMAGVAHEIANPLSFIRTYATLVEQISRDLLLVASEDAAERERKIAKILEYERKIDEGLTRLTVTATSLKHVSRSRGGTRRAENLNEIVKSVLSLVHPRLGHTIAVREDLTEKAAVWVNGGEISQIVLNLVLNAADAMEPSGGTLVVRTFDRDGRVVLEIEDSGPGIDPVVASRLFTPFFTTKGDGTGLGLSVSRRIAQEHGGSLTFVPDRKPGALFRMELPASQ